MVAPVFEDVDPASDCDCPECAHRRRVSRSPLRGRFGGRPAARGALVVAAAASAAVAAGHPAAALAAAPAPQPPGGPHIAADGDVPDTPQGARGPLFGPGGKQGKPADPEHVPATTRTAIINRAKLWVAAKVPYSMDAYWSDGYRQDCSGYVSMAWNLGSNEWTGSLGQYGVKITKAELAPGDMLLFHNPDNPEKGSHVVLFGGWADHTHTHYAAYEQTPPNTRTQATPYAYWSNSAKYVPYRYKGVTPSAADAKEAGGTSASDWELPVAGRGGDTAPGAPGTPASHGVAGYPGRNLFRPGADNPYVTRLGRRLVEKGFGRYYTEGPGPRWSEADRRAVEAFQRSQGWRGGAADGYPGPETWRRLFA